MKSQATPSEADFVSDMNLLPRRHDKYFMEDGNVAFTVENVLFNVHRFFFQRDSEFFRDIFTSHEIPDEYGIPLNGITHQEFERFLGVLYPEDFEKHNASTVEEWTSILDLAVRWGFQSIRSLAIKELGPIASPVDKIVLGRKHDVSAWLAAAYDATCKRVDALTLKEGQRLGLAEVVKISEVRQRIRLNKGLVSLEESSSIVEKSFGLQEGPIKTQFHGIKVEREVKWEKQELSSDSSSESDEERETAKPAVSMSYNSSRKGKKGKK